MKVVSFEKVIPQKNTSQEKIGIIHNFIQGVQAAGDTGSINSTFDYETCDVAVIQGWQHERGKSAPHLALRQKIIDTQAMHKKYTITGDSNLFLYANKSNHPHHYLRYSFNGIFPTTGIYCDNIVDPKRWQQISRDCDIKLEKYKRKGKNIVICLQRNGGWSMKGLDVQSWAIKTIGQIRLHTDRPIVLRPHPGDSKAMSYLGPRLSRLTNKGVYISAQGTHLENDLAKAWAVVNHNSSSIVGPVIQGYHAFITDPTDSQCKEIADTDFSNIENPKHFDRQQWLERISMFHWKFSELQNGACWRHMRNYCQ